VDTTVIERCSSEPLKRSTVSATEGADRFGWEPRDPSPRVRRERGWLIGTGVAASIYPSPRLPGNAATIRVGPDGRYTVMIGAADIGTGTWTALTQIAADALGVAIDDVELQIGDTTLPLASSASFSSGIIAGHDDLHRSRQAARTPGIRARRNGAGRGLEVTTDIPDNPDMGQYAMYSFGAQSACTRTPAS
jgi:xanthine dehydrogenase YagR molybdenum-binding subunit